VLQDEQMVSLFRSIQGSIRRMVKRAGPMTADQCQRYWCDWPWSTLVILCDGKVVCGCADPRGLRPVGHVRRQKLDEIWHGRTMETIRKGLINGRATFCRDCGLKELISDPSFSPDNVSVPSGPTRLFIEPTIHCNISCVNSHCNRESGIIGTRERGLMPFEMFCGIVDQASDTLERLELFNYGEPFLNKKLRRPTVWSGTGSTNSKQLLIAVSTRSSSR
jgi:MoaA/NifB/PqqE/SkfB family radical SAM enzyme